MSSRLHGSYGFVVVLVGYKFWFHTYFCTFRFRNYSIGSTPHPVTVRESQPKPLFATVTGWGVDTNYNNLPIDSFC